MFKRSLYFFLIIWLSSCSHIGLKHKKHKKSTYSHKKVSTKPRIVVYKRAKNAKGERLVKRTVTRTTRTPSSQKSKSQKNISINTNTSLQTQKRIQTYLSKPKKRTQKKSILSKNLDKKIRLLKQSKKRKLAAMLKKFEEEDRKSQLMLKRANEKALAKKKREAARLLQEDEETKRVTQETRKRYLNKMKESTAKIIHKQEIEGIETEAEILLLQKQRETAHQFKEKQLKVAKKIQQQAKVQKKTSSRQFTLHRLSQDADIFGTSEVHGRVVFTNNIGAKIPLYATKAYIVPYSRYKGGDNFAYTAATNVNSQGKFAFYGLPNEKFYIVIESQASGYKGKIYMKKEINFHNTNTINTVFRKQF